MKDAFARRLNNCVRDLFIWAQTATGFAFRLLAPPKDRWTTPCRSVSVVIPALNEEKTIVDCIRSVAGNRYVIEVVVVDGGSSDQTCLLARQNGARVLVHERPVENGGGRGGQIKRGIEAAGGDAVAILHADCVLPGENVDRIVALLNHHPDVIGGSVGGQFDSPKLRFRILALANDLRAAFLKISFGDQVQFFRRRPVVARDLFPGIPLMEDVEFSIRLHRLGQRVHLLGSARVSTRRWRKIGFRNAPWVIITVAKYLIRRLVAEPDTAALYKHYYKPGEGRLPGRV
ncbi:MAG: glycosyltransferase [Thermodesulfobacteriota bacterium]